MLERLASFRRHLRRLAADLYLLGSAHNARNVMQDARGVIAAVLMGVTACSPVARPGSAMPCEPSACEADVTASGRFHIVWNGTTRYYLVDDSAQSTELLLDAETARAAEGRLALDRRRVIVSGVRESATVLRVRSIRADTTAGASP